MNPKDKEMLEKINRIAMRSEGRDIIKTVDIHAEHRETLKRLSDDNRLSDNSRKVARQMLEDPRMYMTKEEINEEKARRMEASVERDIKRAIQQGTLSSPDDSVNNFMKRFDT
jgi:hypothetical protein